MKKINILPKVLIALAISSPSVAMARGVFISFNSNLMSAQFSETRYSNNSIERVQAYNNGAYVSFYAVNELGQSWSCYVTSTNPLVSFEKAKIVADNFGNGNAVTLTRDPETNFCKQLFTSTDSRKIRSLTAF